MKSKIFTYIIGTGILTIGAGIYSLNANHSAFTESSPEMELVEEPNETTGIPQDTVRQSRYPVAKTVPEEYNDIVKKSPADLKNPENIKTEIEYDIKTGTYVVSTKLGEAQLTTPLTLTPEQYQDYSLQKSIQAYYRQKNQEEFQKVAEKKFDVTNMEFGIGQAEKIFGPGGVRVRTQGSANISLGLKTNITDNPSLPARSRKTTFFDFDENVQLNVQASVGSKVNFGMNYNTETSFDFDSKKLKLGYTGEEDEIIKSIEAGNVSMSTSNSLINGGSALFGMKADLQFGKLRVNTVIAQQESESKTVTSKGGAQTKSFEIKADEYDENRHFFIAQYFRDNFDSGMSKLPYVSSSVSINKIEVWVTNKKGVYDDSRNIVAFSDLGENKHISNHRFIAQGSTTLPYNKANTLYETILNNYPNARNIDQVNQVLGGDFESGRDYEKVESARLLNSSEYTYNKQLGFISLSSQLSSDEVLAVAFQYTSNGKVYQVGEFSTDDANNTTNCLYLKLLKGTSEAPGLPFWNLMMKNIYSLGAYSIQSDKFRLNIQYQSDTLGTYLDYISEGNIKNMTLLRVMNLDRLNKSNQAYPDGYFDFVSGYTILPETGKIIFPVVEPFGAHLRKAIGNDAIANKYVFQELYDSTLTIAKQIAEKDKYILTGEYRASNSSEISLGATNVARGSVVVKAGGTILTENVDYTVDYTSGTVTILNESVISSGQTISVSLENQSAYNMQRKTMMGVNLDYQISPNLTIGGTLMHLSEMPLTTKTTMGDESVRNTLWGFNMSYKGESQWLTNALDKLPLLTLTKPSSISFDAEFANLIAGHYSNSNTGGYSYIDDFESTQTGYDLLNPYSWMLSSVPYSDASHPLFPEASLVNNINYGKNRALMSWYYVDGLFTRSSSALRPKYIDKNALSNHYIRAVETTELYPERQTTVSESSTLQVLNVAYYPNERGPYNLDADNINSDGTLKNPEKRFGGIMRKLETTDFETANIEYINFWVMDPFIYNRNVDGGDLYFNLGEISEDVLKDEKKFYENGLPIDGSTTKVDTTVWGKVPNTTSTVYAFDNTTGARDIQDVGLNGLSAEEEKTFPVYQDYLNKLRTKLSAETLNQMESDPLELSPFFDPSGDKYHYFRGSDYDNQQTDILTRYKRYNGTEGNSPDSNNSTEKYSTAYKSTPDVEDINQDNTLNENEKYFEYKVSIRPQDTIVGSNYIVDKRVARVKLANGEWSDVTWYQFKIPVKSYTNRVGSISDFKTVRFMRMYMTGFKDPTVLRFGAFELIRGEWRNYEQTLYPLTSVPTINGTISTSTVNIEENSEKQPVNYVLPPGVTRVLDPSQPQLRQENEQALSMKIANLAPQDARAIYKSTSYDLRQYKKLQLFTHAEAFVDDVTGLSNGELSVFIRLGSDYKNNYYEYEVPLTLTPAGRYSVNSSADRETVWPEKNMLNFAFKKLTDLKLARNKAKREGVAGVSFSTVYSDYDPDNTLNKITVKGNPSLAEVKVIMIGVRNNSKQIKSAEVWVNELRLTDLSDDGGWAANADLNVALSDLGTVTANGHLETAGFGGLDQSLTERRLDDLKQYSVSASLELGKFFPEKAKVSIPFYYAYSKEIVDPLYDPLNEDIKLKDALSAVDTKAEKDSIKFYARQRTVIKSISFNNVKVDIRSKTPMPYDPANFTFGYSYSENTTRNPETEYETTKNWRGSFAYNYTPYATPFKPFEKMKSKSGATKYLRQLSLNYLPSNISFQTNMVRNYYEQQLRDLSVNSSGTETTSKLPVTFSQEWYWDRAFNLRWDFTQNLNINFTSGTNAQIEEPYMQVNKKLNPDQYQVWKDSVKQSIENLGRPLKYDQQFQATWTMPLQQIPILDWTQATASYNAQYTWDRGADLSDDLEVGNTITNQRQFTIQGGFNLLSLYNKNKFLKQINQKYSGTNAALPPARATNNKQANNANSKDKAAQAKKPRRFEKDIALSPDSAVRVHHDFFSKRIHLTARGANGKLYRIKYKILDFANVEIQNRDTAHIKVIIIPGEAPSEVRLVTAKEYAARFLMMLRRINIQYTNTAGMSLPGFRPEIGDMLGQKKTEFGMTPGIGFAFGDVRRSYINDANDRGWLVSDTNNISPAVMSNAKNIDIQATLEPIAGLKIDLNATRVDTRNNEIQYMYNGMPEIKGGNFTMTTVAIGSAFQGTGNALNGYNSKVFNKFLEYRSTIAARYENKYGQTGYPNRGFISGSDLANKPYDSSNGSVSKNSADVLIPAFLAAYTGKNANSIGLTAFPSLKSMMPNWRITYDGLIKIPVIRRNFKQFTISHQYRCSYQVGSYTSFLNWVDAGQDDLGYIEDILTGNPTPSSPYSITSVNITEGFSPLLGANATLLNNVTLNADYTTTRNLSLNISSYQLVEALNKKITIGVGYKFAEFNKVLKMKKTKNYSNDLTVRLDMSLSRMESLIRKIEDATTTATSGNKATTLQFSADYGLSKALTLRAFYDLQINRPLISSTAYPTTSANYGLSMRFSLAQ